MSLAPLQQYHANHPSAADIFDLHSPAAVELVRLLWELAREWRQRAPKMDLATHWSQDASQVNPRARN